MMSVLRLVLLWSIVISIGAERNSYSLVENKYENLLIAISEDVAEDLNLLQRTKDAFTMLSRDMFVATKRRAYLGNVTILVPKSWTRNLDWEVASLETFDRSNVIVDKANPRTQDNPYVNQPGKCGEPGRYMHLTPRYLTDRRLARQWGPTGKTILHEFGHLRWGLFDEYPIPDEGYKKFYHSVAPDGSTVVEPVRCSKTMYGESKHEVTGKACVTDPTTSLPEEACTFFPPRNKGQSPAKSSLMFWHFMTYSDSFCDNDASDPLTYHNYEAPNKHNRLCKGKSQWEVMREHVDFRDNNNSPINSSLLVDTTPIFKVVQLGDPRLVFVIDVSGSMNTNNRLIKATQAAAEAIQMGIELESYVGIVKFSTEASTVHPLVKITNDTVRQSLITALPMVATGQTAIGKGLLEAMKILREHGDSRGGKIILLSDGAENRDPRIAEVLPSIKTAGVIIDSILLSDNADPGLLSLASKTGGSPFFATDSSNSTSLTDAFTKSVTKESQQSAFVKVLGETVSLNAQSNYTQSIFIDEEIGNSTEFTITYQSQGTPLVTVELTKPSGTPVVVPSFSSSILRVSIPGEAESGEWSLSIKNNRNSVVQVQMSVTSRSKSPDVKPITLTSELGQENVNFNDANSLRMTIFATLTKGYSPVVDAEVYATVESGTSESTIRLLDNGAGGDTTKEDGIYSAYFLNFDGNGGYAVKVKVNDKTGKARLKSSKSSGQQSAVDVCFMEGNCSTPQVVPVYKPVNQISRVASAGSFQVVNTPSGPNANVDLFAPDQISDITVVTAFYENKTVTLQWTAVGDDLDQGQASWYDLRLHTNLTTLREQFSTSVAVNQSSILKGNLTHPKTSGEIEVFEIQLTSVQKEVTYFFGIKAIDDNNKAGDISNIVPVAFTIKQPTRYVGIEPEPEETSTATYEVTSVVNNQLPLEVILGLSLGIAAVVVVALIILLAVCMMKKNPKLGVAEMNATAPKPETAHDNPTYANENVIV